MIWININAKLQTSQNGSGLVHISQITNRYISDPAEVVKVNQKVQVKVLEVDIQRKRVSLSMKGVN